MNPYADFWVEDFYRDGIRMFRVMRFAGSQGTSVVWDNLPSLEMAYTLVAGETGFPKKKLLAPAPKP